ncbi:MAG: glycosyltransferase family 2 protein [Deltaproteobacteria bacterium]|jgi:glycosyltransferase involved in cell wall biosynthesis|nr:glycosyltransferase family 2 protein [Deltaproteobacteria bacterium]
MYKSKSLCVVVPAYNEEILLARTVTGMPEFVDRIVVVDDRSTDGTPGEAERLAAEDPRVVVLTHAENQGVGGAIATGYKWARDNGMDMAAVMAGDGQMDPADLPALCDPVAVEGVDYAKGNRLVHAEAYESIPKVRFFGNAVLSFLTKISSGYWHVADSQTGYTVISKRALAAVDWDRMYRRYGQPNDLLVRLNVEDMRVRDVPVRPVYNIGEKSGFRPHKVLWPISRLLIRMYIWRLWKKYMIRDAHPLFLFILTGLMLFGLGFLFFLRLVYLFMSQGQMPEITLIVLLFTVFLGLQSFLFGVWMDMDRNKELR